MREKIIDIIYEISENEEFKENPDIDLIENEIIDSIDFVELISILEDTFDIELVPSQIPSNNWRSVDCIVKIIEEYIGEKNGKN